MQQPFTVKGTAKDTSLLKTEGKMEGNEIQTAVAVAWKSTAIRNQSFNATAIWGNKESGIIMSAGLLKSI